MPKRALTIVALLLPLSLVLTATTNHLFGRTLQHVAAFLVFGPLGEELLFRGLIYERVQLVWPRSSLLPIVISSLAFGLHHIWLSTAPDGLALAQLMFTLPMGIALALLRQRSGSIWPSALLHFATNLPATFG